MATVSIKWIATAVMVSSALSFTPKLTFAGNPDGMMAFDAQKIQTMCSFTNYSSVPKDGSEKNKVTFISTAGKAKWQTFSKSCSSKNSVPRLDPQLPLDQQVIKDGEEKSIWYKKINDGSGDDIVNSNSKLMIHFNLYDNESDQPVSTNKIKGPKRQRSPTEIRMCDPQYTEEFTKALEGMRVGEIRRIIFRKDLLKNLPKDPFAKDLTEKDLIAKFKNYAVLDVELVDVCPSKSCFFRDAF